VTRQIVYCDMRCCNSCFDKITITEMGGGDDNEDDYDEERCCIRCCCCFRCLLIITFVACIFILILTVYIAIKNRTAT